MSKYYVARLVPTVGLGSNKPGDENHEAKTFVFFNLDTGHVLLSKRDRERLVCQSVGNITEFASQYCVEFNPDRSHTLTEVWGLHKRRLKNLEEESAVQKIIHAGSASGGSHLTSGDRAGL